MTRRERLEAKLEKRQEWAEKASTRSTQRYAAASAIADRIPLGQPILVGHHSERGARADANRIAGHMDASVAEAAKATYHEQKADGLARQLAHTVFSDDPDAIKTLQAKIDQAEKFQALMVAANKLVRKKDREGLAKLGLTAIQIDKLFLPDFAGRIGFADYALTNNKANIRRMKARIVEIQTRQQRTDRADASGGVTIDGSDTYARVTFAEKPERSILDALKAAGFRWSGGSWYGPRASLPAALATI